MSADIDSRIVWLARLISAPCWLAAFRIAGDRTRQVAGFDDVSELDAAGSVSDEERSLLVSGFAERVRVIDPVLSCAFHLLALRPANDPL